MLSVSVRLPKKKDSKWILDPRAQGLPEEHCKSVVSSISEHHRAKTYAAREIVFCRYLEILQCQRLRLCLTLDTATKISDCHQISDEDIAHLDVSNSHAVLSNTLPTAFWTVFHIFSDTKVLNEIWAALTLFLKIEKKSTGTVTYELDVGRVRDIPILRSTMQVALRHCANGTETRVVLEAIMLNDSYLLKKVAFLFMPNRSYHLDDLGL